MAASYPSSQVTPLRLREQDLENKVAIITGASRGIGRATALHLASRGCSILATCSSEKSLHLIDTLEHTVRGLYDRPSGADNQEKPARKPSVVALAADIFAPDCAQKIADSIEKHFSSRVDIFINNACDPNVSPVGEITAEQIQHSLLGNIQTPVLIVDELVKRKLFQPSSRIVYISSIRAKLPWADQLLYSAGKSAGESLCRTWADAFGGKFEKVVFPTLHLELIILAKANLHPVQIYGWEYSKCRNRRLNIDTSSHGLPS